MTHASPIPGPKICLMGESGSGKTTALRTLIECGITPMVLFTEAGMETLGDLPKDKVHWRYIKETSASWGDLTANVKLVNQMTYEGLSKMGPSGREAISPMQRVLETCNKFVCDRTGEDFGCVDDWGTDRAFCVDSLTGLSSMAMALTVGYKAVRSPGEWGVAQNQLEFIIKKMQSVFCTFVLIAHVEREVDEIQGGAKLMVSTLGKKLAPKIPIAMSDLILTEKRGKEWFWNTANPQASTKTRNLDISDKLVPSFVPIIESWKAQGGIIGP